MVGVKSERQLGEHDPPTQPLGPPSVSTGEKQLLSPKMSLAPAHWLTSVHAPPEGVPPELPPHWPCVQVLLPQLWQTPAPNPQARLELPGWQTPKVSQQPVQLAGLHAADWH